MATLISSDTFDPTTKTIPPGTIVRGRYEVICLLGHGGNGAVYKASDEQHHDAVALKQARKVSDVLRQAFGRDGALLTALRHGGLPPVIDCFMEGDDAFLVTPFVVGDDLAATLRKRKKVLPLHEVLHWTSLLLEVVSYLHEQEPPIVHGDIKPSNLKPANGELQLLDLGLPTRTAGEASHETTPQRGAGYNLRYVAPERIEGAPARIAGDLYSLGATLYHLVTGTPPPASPERVASVHGGKPDPVQPPDVLNPSVPQSVSRALVRAMALAPADRFHSASEMRTALYTGELASDDARMLVPAPDLGPVWSQPRRVDAAAPTWVSEGRPFDVIVQARFSDSPRLGREDWPVEGRPVDTVQPVHGSQITLPIDRSTGAPQPSVLFIDVVAPDFVDAGASAQLLVVPPDDYSKRVSFTLKTTKVGLFRVTVEVRTPEGGYFGALPLDVRVGGELARPPLKVMHVILPVQARRADGA